MWFGWFSVGKVSRLKRRQSRTKPYLATRRNPIKLTTIGVHFINHLTLMEKRKCIEKEVRKKQTNQKTYEKLLRLCMRDV